MRWRRPALAVYADGEPAHASPHHVGCRPPGRHKGPMEAVSDIPHLTWRAGTFAVPALLTLGVASDGAPFWTVGVHKELGSAVGCTRRRRTSPRPEA
ncbi:hypothetical protein [Streptomyces sp. NPDC055013]